MSKYRQIHQAQKLSSEFFSFSTVALYPASTALSNAFQSRSSISPKSGTIVMSDLWVFLSGASGAVAVRINNSAIGGGE